MWNLEEVINLYHTRGLASRFNNFRHERAAGSISVHFVQITVFCSNFHRYKSISLKSHSFIAKTTLLLLVARLIFVTSPTLV